GELFGELNNRWVQVNGGGVLQQAGLFADAFDDFRMTMTDADRDDASEGIQISAAHFVPYVLHLAFDDHQRFAVVRDDAGREILMAQRQDFVARRSFVRRGLVIDNRQRRVKFGGHGKTPSQREVWWRQNTILPRSRKNCYVRRRRAGMVGMLR